MRAPENPGAGLVLFYILLLPLVVSFRFLQHILPKWVVPTVFYSFIGLGVVWLILIFTSPLWADNKEKKSHE